MKHICLISIFLFALVITKAQTNVVVISNGKWSENSTWSLGRSPIAGETVSIPKDSSVLVDKNFSISPANITINVFGKLDFQVGKLILGSGSIVSVFSGGTITSKQGNPSDRIEIGDVIKYSGSQGTMAGPITLNFSTTAPVILPVKFVAYNVLPTTAGNEIRWSTAEEWNADIYIIERSTDSRNWQAIASINAAGNSTSLNSYFYTDKAAIAPINYYRIRQVDRDGHSIYTAVRYLKKNAIGNTDVQVFATNNDITVTFLKVWKGSLIVRLVALSGQVVSTQKYNEPPAQIVFKQNSIKGNHFIVISDGISNITKQVLL